MFAFLRHSERDCFLLNATMLIAVDLSTKHNLFALPVEMTVPLAVRGA